MTAPPSPPPLPPPPSPQGFHGLDAVPVTQTTISKYWSKCKHEPNEWPGLILSYLPPDFRGKVFIPVRSQAFWHQFHLNEHQNEILRMAKQMVKERQDITGSNCLKRVSGKVIVDEKGIKDSWKEYMYMEQEGQHPLTWQRKAKFRLLVNQWAERRLVSSDAMTSRLPHCEAKCVQCRCFQWRSIPLHSDIKGMELPLPIYSYHSKGNWLRYNFCRWQFLYNETLQQTFRPLLSNSSKGRQI